MHVRQVVTTPSGTAVFAYQTRPTLKHPRLVLYLTVAGPMQDVTIEGFLLPAPVTDDE